jgi:hypothetical protein
VKVSDLGPNCRVTERPARIHRIIDRPLLAQYCLCLLDVAQQLRVADGNLARIDTPLAGTVCMTRRESGQWLKCITAYL